jgi:UDP-glucose 4-epimerase
VLPNFAQQALRGEPITVYGSGQQSRCFGHVRDAVEAMIRLIATPAALGQVFNVGTTTEVSMVDLATRVRDAAGSSSEIRLVPYSEAYAAGFEDMMRRVPDVSKLLRVTGFKPMTPLDEIIHDVVEDQRARLGSTATAGATGA